VYDPGADAWIKAPDMPTARSGTASAVIDGEMVVLGGESRSQTYGAVEAFDPVRNAWRKLPDLPTPRHGFGAAVRDGHLFTLV
ncbi:kelch repeat-containing protein, partial [Proteus mirabilis]